MRRLPGYLFAASCVVASPNAAAQDLSDTIARAVAHSPALEEAQAGEAAARARLDQARAERNPLLRVEGSAGAGRIDNGGFFGIAPANTYPLSIQATAEMPLFAGGRIGSAIDQAGGGAEIAGLQHEQVRLQAIVQAVAAHAEVLTARKLEQRFQLLATALAETERQARLRFSAGDIASTELAQARARRAEADAGLAQAQGRRIAGEAAYLRLTGQPAGDLAALPGLPAVPATLDDALSAARATNPALLQAQAATRVARAGLRSARADGLPQVGAFAEAAHVADQFFPGYKADSVAVGLRGRWTLFSAGRDGAKVRAARADAGASDARLRQAEQAVDGMVIDAWQGLKTAQQMLAASTLRSEAAAEALRGRRLEAKVGAVPTLAVLDAEREAVEAEAARLEAAGTQQVMAWRLDALTGQLPDLPAR